MYVSKPTSTIGPLNLPSYLIMETRTCPTCNGSTVAETLTRCPNYDRPVHGRPCSTPGCGSRNRFSHRYIASVRRPCTHCNATGRLPETLYDSVPPQIWAELPMRVYDRASSPLTWIESYVGAGVYSVVDYGRHLTMTDDELIAEVRKSTYHQAIKIARPYPAATALTDDEAGGPNDRERGILCNHIAIIRRRDGYTVEAAFAIDATTIAVDLAVPNTERSVTQMGREPTPNA